MSLELIQGFAISKKPYSINPETFTSTPIGAPKPGEMSSWLVEVDSIWFRRKYQVLSAHYGKLWEVITQVGEPTLDSFLRGYSNRWNGGRIIARWDGRSLWTQDRLTRDEEDRIIEFLDPALANFPAPPSGYDGWFVYNDN